MPISEAGWTQAGGPAGRLSSPDAGSATTGTARPGSVFWTAVYSLL